MTANIAQLPADRLATPERALYRQFADGAWRDYTAAEIAAATLKIRRNAVLKRFAPQIEAAYASGTTVD